MIWMECLLPSAENSLSKAPDTKPGAPTRTTILSHFTLHPVITHGDLMKAIEIESSPQFWPANPTSLC